MLLGRRALIAGLAVAGVAASCARPSGWRRVDLAGRNPVTLTGFGDSVLVGTAAPGLVRLRNGIISDLVVRGSSPYSGQTRWRSLDARDGEIIAIGHTRGGAHANSRWTVWHGTEAGLTEQPQSFDTFHGWGSGELLGAGWSQGQPVLVGSWQSEAAGLEPTTWRLSGATWERLPSAGGALANTTQELHRARSVATVDGELAIAGQLIELDPGLALRPAVWSSSPSGWQRHLLPADADAVAESVGAGLVLGRQGGVLRAWALGAGSPAPPDPGHPVPESGVIPAPVRRDDHPHALVPAGTGSVLLSLGGGWQAAPGPPGTPTALATSASGLFALTSDPEGTRTLWAAD